MRPDDPPWLRLLAPLFLVVFLMLWWLWHMQRATPWPMAIPAHRAWGRFAWVRMAGHRSLHCVRIIDDAVRPPRWTLHTFYGLGCAWVSWIPLTMRAPHDVRIVMHTCTSPYRPGTVAEALELKDDAPVILLGHSMGCIPLLETATTMVHAPHAVVLLNPAFFTVRTWADPLVPRHPVLYGWAARLLAFARSMPAAWLSSMLGWLARHAYHLYGRLDSLRGHRLPAFAVTKDWQEEVVDTIHTFDTFGCGSIPCSHRDIRGAMNTLLARGVRIVVVYGDGDYIVRPLVGLPPQATTVVIRGVGHLLPMTQPDAVWRVLRKLAPR